MSGLSKEEVEALPVELAELLTAFRRDLLSRGLPVADLQASMRHASLTARCSRALHALPDLLTSARRDLREAALRLRNEVEYLSFYVDKPAFRSVLALLKEVNPLLADEPEASNASALKAPPKKTGEATDYRKGEDQDG